MTFDDSTQGAHAVPWLGGRGAHTGFVPADYLNGGAVSFRVGRNRPDAIEVCRLDAEVRGVISDDDEQRVVWLELGLRALQIEHAHSATSFMLREDALRAAHA